jgi:hypothetical protein
MTGCQYVEDVYPGLHMTACSMVIARRQEKKYISSVFSPRGTNPTISAPLTI